MIPFPRMIQYGPPDTLLKGEYTQVGAAATQGTFDIGSAYYNHNVYIMGGIRASAQATQTCFSYNTTMPNAITAMANLPRITFGMGSAGYNNKIYIFGGMYRTSSGGTNNPSTALYAYDISTNSWSTVSTSNTPSTGGYCAMVNIGSNMYIYGLGTTNKMHKYDINTSTFTELASATTALQSVGCICTDGTRFIYVTSNNNIERYDINNNTWTVLQTGTNISGACVYYKGRVYIQAANKFGRYNISTNTFDIVTTTIPYVRNSLVSSGSKVFCNLGYSSASDISTKIYQIR